MDSRIKERMLIKTQVFALETTILSVQEHEKRQKETEMVDTEQLNMFLNIQSPSFPAMEKGD